MAWTEEKRRESGENVERDRGRWMKRWRHEENDRTAEKKRWRLGEWRRVGWWFRRERESFALGFVERERMRESRWAFTNLIRGVRG